jgi:hypothetical protein
MFSAGVPGWCFRTFFGFVLFFGGVERRFCFFKEVFGMKCETIKFAYM